MTFSLKTFVSSSPHRLCNIDRSKLSSSPSQGKKN
jgi:hypothetical protein